jgi:hypothetical protein
MSVAGKTPGVEAVVSFFGPGPESWYIGRFLGVEEPADAFDRRLANFPPTLLIHGGRDPGCACRPIACKSFKNSDCDSRGVDSGGGGTYAGVSRWKDFRSEWSRGHGRASRPVCGMTYRFLSPALNELEKAAEFYDDCVPGLGVEFIDEVDAAIERILQFPAAWGKISDDFRHCKLRRFPQRFDFGAAERTRRPRRWKSAGQEMECSPRNHL